MQQQGLSSLVFWDHWFQDAYHQDGYPLIEEDSDLSVVLPARETRALGILSDPGATLDPATAHDHLMLGVALKKWRLPILSDLESVALEGFKVRNASVADRTGIPRYLRDIMRRLLAAWLPALDVYPDPKLGPGAVAEHYDYLRKRQLLSRVAPLFDSFLPERIDVLYGHQHARLCAVPKQWNKMRLITVEPYFNTLAQQAARAYVWKCLQSGPLTRYHCWRHFWESMPDEQRRRALHGSANHSIATIDLSDASDRISYDLVADVFPGHIMAWLDWSRTPHFRIGTDEYDLQIYAGMGNATTFIVETLLFHAYVTAVSVYRHIRCGCTVFGDDIICSSSLYESGFLNDAPEFFRINQQKTYSGECPLRESCGVFAYNGHDLNLIRVNGYDCNSWSSRLAVADLHRRLNKSPYVGDLIMALYLAELGVLPNYRDDVDNYPCTSNWAVPFSTPPSRYNRDLQRKEVRLPTWLPRQRYVDANKQWMLVASLLDASHVTIKNGNATVCVTDYNSGHTHDRWHATGLAKDFTLPSLR